MVRFVMLCNSGAQVGYITQREMVDFFDAGSQTRTATLQKLARIGRAFFAGPLVLESNG